MEEFLNKTELMSRPHWNKSLVKKLLPEPDNIRYRPNGTVLKYDYSLNRIEQAETTGLFKERVEHEKRCAEQDESRRNEIIQGLEFSAEQDLNNLRVPETGTFEQTYQSCLQQMVLYNKMKLMIGDYRYPDVYPYAEIIRQISKKRSDLSFEAGIHYLESVCTSNYRGFIARSATSIMDEVHEVEAEEKASGQPCYHFFVADEV